MAERRKEHQRRTLPLQSNVRRVLNLEPNHQAPASSNPQPRRYNQRLQQEQVSGSGPVTTTPRKHRGILRGLRRQIGGLKQREIEEYLLEPDGNLRRREDDGDWWSSSSNDDITPEEDSGEEYQPPLSARKEREREQQQREPQREQEQQREQPEQQREQQEQEESELEFSGFSAYEEEEEEERARDVSGVVDSESDGESEGDGSVGGRDVRERTHGRARGRARARGRGQGRADGSSSRSPVGGGWSEDPTPPSRHPFTATPGLSVPVPTSPLGFIQLFITRELLEYLVLETNDYARYCREELGKTLSYKWNYLNVTDMAHYLGVNVFFGIHQ